jgi:beta-N-acetylhexosaminidase
LIRADWTRLNAVELVPFRAAVAAGVDAIMSAHLALPGFDGDSTRPATLSPAVMTGMLRDSLRFKGLVVTDALDMGALVTTYGGGEATVRAFEAGTDLLLMPANPRQAIDAMVAAVTSGRIPRSRLAQSVLKVLTIKERLGLFKQRTVSLDRVGTIVAQKAFMDTAKSIAARSLVLVRDSGGVVAKIRQGDGDLALVTYGDPEWATALPRLLTKRAHRVLPFRLYPTSGPASYDSARAVLARAETAVFSVAVRVASGSGTIAMPLALGELIESTTRTQATAMVSFGSPYLLSQAPSPGGLLLAWIAGPATEEAVANALSGAAITGRLPIDLPPRSRMGDGLSLAATTRFNANATP